MASGGPGDHPLTDITIWHRPVYNDVTDALILKIAGLCSRRELWEWWDRQIGWKADPALVDRVSKERYVELTASAKQNGWELPKYEFQETWTLSGSKMVVGGDHEIIQDLITNQLDQVKVDSSGWLSLYRHRDSGEFWELSYPQGEMHGGGPRMLRRVFLSHADDWIMPA
jgi:hypothetical protein